MADIDVQLLAQLKTWNPWWQQGKDGIARYKDPAYKRELYESVSNQYQEGNQIVSIVGMRQVGKSTLMRQIIKELLDSGVDPKTILYISFDDPFVRIKYDKKKIFDTVVETFMGGLIGNSLDQYQGKLYFFLDEIHQLPDWEKTLKAYYDRSFPISYMVSGSSSLHLQSKNKESLLGRISEHVLWPFSFREYLEYHESDNGQILGVIAEAKVIYDQYNTSFNIQELYQALHNLYEKAFVWHKTTIEKNLQSFIVCGGFPRAWQQPDFVSRQRILWEQHVGKVIFEDLVQVARIRKPRDLEFLFTYIIENNGKEVKLGEMKRNLNIHWETLDRYLSYLIRTFLIFRIERTKTKRLLLKKRSGNVKFYLTDVALRNAFYNKTEDVFFIPEEMSFIAENLVCTSIERWLRGPKREEQVSFYKDRGGEVDFVFKGFNTIIPIEVKWRNDMPSLKTLQKVENSWEVDQSILITKDQELDFRDKRLSIPLWFFLLCF
ncbi:MAG: ATP-binding protein [Candidatus Levybacteria bacterium]|nr:ATP-binding protein [Candidatus Levybacteria bacterium]